MAQEQMQHNSKKIKHIFYKIVCSISFRIISTLLFIMGVVFVSIFLKQKQTIYEYTEQYFSTIGAMASEILAGTIAENETELHEFIDEAFLDQLQKLCAEYDFSDFYIEKSEPPYTYAREILYVDAKEKIVRNEKHDRDPVIDYLSKEEQEVFTGKRPFLYMPYVEKGKMYSSYISGLYDDQDQCFAVIGVDFLTDNILKDISQHTAESTGYLLLAVVLSCIVIIIGLHLLVVKPIKMINSKLRDFVSGNKLNPEHLNVRGRGELAQMAEAYNSMVDDVTQYFQTLEVITAAAAIQKGLLPEEHFENQAVRIDAFLRPAKYIGGDFYDYYILDEDHIGIVIADVSGKGMSAAMFMANAVNTIKYNAKRNFLPSKILSAANNDLSDRNPEHLFVTVFIAVYDCRRHTLTYSNGGHNHPYIVRNRQAIELDQAGGLLLGLFPDETYEDCTIDILPDDVLFLYTDGLNEAVSSGKTFFGEQRIRDVLETIDEKDAVISIPDIMKDSVDAFTGDMEPHDDLTMLSAAFYSRRQLKIAASIDHMDEARQFIMQNPWIPEKERRKIFLALEEVLVNIILYGFPESEDGVIWIIFRAVPGGIELVIQDNGYPYNPLEHVIKKEDYDPDLQCGGLGKLIAFSIMKAEYQYQDNRNILVLKKEFKNDHSKRNNRADSNTEA